MRIVATILCVFAASTAAYNVNGPLNRRAAFQKAAVAASAVAVASSPALANALEACPAKSQNCIRTAWTPPAGTSQADASAAVKKVIESYPQEGQNKADLGGWTIVEDNFKTGSASIEYKSGIGNFAKFLNGGKPFVDDLKLEIGTDAIVQVRSSSRIGESDFGVNKKRLQYLSSKLSADGWACPEPAY